MGYEPGPNRGQEGNVPMPTAGEVERSRLMIIRRGDGDLLEHFQQRFAHESSTVVIYDRRVAPPSPATPERRSSDRRRLDNVAILARRGYFATRIRNSTSPD